MNDEQLAMDLRKEIETYLRTTVADLRQEIAELQDRVNAEIDSHRSKIEESFSEIMSRGNAVTVDDDFARLVAEHLKIAREDGAKDAETAFEQTRAADEEARSLAAETEKSAAQNTADFSQLRDAISDITAQSSQAEILKALVKHSSNFAARGAFFIVKSEHLVGWRLLGSEMTGGDESVREVFLSLASNTLLGNSIRENATLTGAANDNLEDAQYLQKLKFGEPKGMTAIPLVVRGRGVAVLYADSGANETPVQTEALETLVRVASQTVELLAAAKSPAARQPAPAARKQPIAEPAYSFAPAATPQPAFAQPSSTPAPVEDFAPAIETAPAEAEIVIADAPQSFERSFDFPVEPKPFEEKPFEAESQPQPAVNFDFNAPESVSFDSKKTQEIPAFDSFSQPPRTEPSFSFETQPTPAPVESQIVPVQDAPPAAARRFGERNVELPIDVPEDERRLHNDARRFARLLVSEIKLYNEQKVKEGRQAGDLYSRLREAIDRSREMYDKRVSPPVAGKFDYFHYELVNTLGEGDGDKLGSEYPGATV